MYRHRSAKLPDELLGLSRTLAEVFNHTLQKFDGPQSKLYRLAVKMVQAVTESLLSHAWQIQQSLAFFEGTRMTGATLVGGAPKLLGRQFARLYGLNGGNVIRIAHGGERCFFDDDHWGLSELPFCHSYCTHGVGEATALESRIKQKRVVNPNKRPLSIIPLGSDRHLHIYERSHESNRKNHRSDKNLRVMFVVGSFLGEAASHVPAIKPSDVMLADLGYFVMNQMRSLGYTVLFKPHPKGALSRTSIYDGLYDEIVTQPFDPVNDDADVYLFDYAGSAFFDALASNKGVVLIDTHVRPFDQAMLPALKSRCDIVDTFRDELNRIRIKDETLKSCIERAAETNQCPEAFMKRYFGPAVEAQSAKLAPDLTHQ